MSGLRGNRTGVSQLLGVLFVLSSCGGSSPAVVERPSGSAGEPSGDGAGGDRAAGSEDRAGGGGASARAGSRYGFAQSPLTGWADGLTDVALAALAGRALPDSPIPIETSGGPLEALRIGDDVRGALASGELTVEGVYLEVELALEPTAATRAPDAGAEEQRGRTDLLSMGLWLGRAGLRIAMLRLERGGGGSPTLPPPPEPVREAVEQLLEALRSGRGASEVAFTPAARSSVHDDRLAVAMLVTAPDEQDLAPTRRALEARPRIRAWAFDELGVIVMAGGRSYLLGMKITLDDSGLVLEAQPLVRATRTLEQAGR